MIEPRIASHELRRSSGLGYAVLLALSVVVLHADLLGGGSAHHRGQDDLELTIPYARALWRAIEAHESPWWLPWIDGGTSAFTRFPSLGPFYPAVLAFSGRDPIRALDWVLLAHVALAAFGTRAWVRALGGSHGAGLVGGFVLAGSSVWHVAAHEGYATEAPVWTWLPWSLAALERARSGEPLRRGAEAAFAVGLLVLGGHATDLYIGLLAAVTYLMARLWVLRGDPAEVRRLVVASVTAATLGAGVGLAFWLPVLRTIDLAGLAAGRAAKPAIPHPVLRLVLPGEAWGTKDSLYVGLVTVAWVVSAFRTESRRRAWPLALVAASALVLSLGPDTALWRALTVLPGFSAVDQANVLSWPFAVFVATLAGLGLPSEAEVSTRRHATLITVAWPLLVADLSILALRGWIEPSRWDLARNVRGRAVVASPRECALVAPPLDDRPHRVLVIERFSPEDELVLWRNDALRLGCIEDVRASAHLGSPRLRRMLRELGPWPVDWDSFSDVRARAPTSLTLAEESRATRVLDLLGVDTVVTDVDVSGVAFERLAGEPALARWIRTDPLPRYRLVAHAEVVNGEEAAADRVLARSFDPRDAVVLEDEARDLSASAPEDRAARPARPAPVRIDRHRPGDILLHSESRPGDVLVVGETWLPGWRATVDGHPATLVRANYLHMALAPPAGSHSIHLTYSPPGLALGVAIASISATLSIVLVVRPPRPRRS